MKDRQVEQLPSQPRIPIVSAVLHCVSMPVLVYLRAGFGYAYLRPRSIFLAACWAFTLYAIYAWNEPAVWRRSAGLCLFGFGASALYIVHFIWAVVSEARGSATHDHDSGLPHTIRLLKAAKVPVSEPLQSLWVIAAEPAMVLFLALLARWPFGAVSLSTWLLLSAPCLFLKELLNYWLQIRQRKKHRDAMEDAEDGMDLSHTEQATLPDSSGRQGKIRRTRSA